jgi:DNA-binding MarR family transcriptional regulator
MLLKRAERRFRLQTSDYARLAAFRQGLREFMRFSEEAAARVGLTTQHYQAMLILRAGSGGARVTINELARQLIIKHNSAVGLVDRLTREGIARRIPSRTDRRKVELELTPRGRQVLARLAETHRRELEHIGPQLKRLIGNVLKQG